MKAYRLQDSIAPGQTTNWEGAQPHPSADSWIKVLLSTSHQRKTQFTPQPVLPVRKLAQASYPHPLEGGQKK